MGLFFYPFDILFPVENGPGNRLFGLFAIKPLKFVERYPVGVLALLVKRAVTGRVVALFGKGVRHLEFVAGIACQTLKVI